MKQLSERYSLGDRIGRGGVGEVFRGWQAALERPVAIKLLRPELTHHKAVVARFKQEARNTCRLHHPNVVTVHDVGETEDGIHFVVMELLEGETLASRMKATGALPPELALPIARQIARGMAAAEGVGLVHRDLKPENIFLINENHVKVLDFGLSTLRRVPAADHSPTESTDATLDDLGLSSEESIDPDGEATVYDPLDSLYDGGGGGEAGSVAPSQGLTRPGAVIGTPRYMSPEQVLGWEVDHRSDLYSFGCILYEMLAGSGPFKGPNSRSYMHQHIYEAPRDLAEIAGHLPPQLIALVHKLVAKGPSERYQSWPQLREALRHLQPPRPERDDSELAPTEEELLPAEPYRFLEPFTRISRGIFFGREGDQQAFMSLWRDPERPPLLILTGASGVGKTSFLRARVIPRLEDADISVMRVVSGEDPMRSLRSALSRELARTSELVAPDAGPAELLNTLLVSQDRPMAIILDQLEEVFTSGGPEQVAGLQAELAAMVAGGGDEVRFVLSLREDFLGALLRALHPLPIDQLTRTLPLRPLDATDLKEALLGPSRPRQPVAYAPFDFEEGLVDEIVADLLSDPAGEVAPRVQAVGAKLWEMVRDEVEPLITRKHYIDGLGGAHGILARLLDEAIEDQGLADQGVAKELLRALTHLPGSQTSRPAPESELLGHADQDRRAAVLRRLEDRWRVIQGFSDPRWPEERTYRITHEALVARIQQYGEEGSSRDRARQIFHHGLTLWLQGGRLSEDLLPEHHFDTVQLHIADLVLRTTGEREFYEECRSRHNDRWMRRHLEARRLRRLRRLRLSLVPLTFIALGFALGQAPVGFVSIHTARIHTAIRLKWPHLDLSGVKLQEAALSGLDMRNVTFTGADLRGADLTGALLAGISLAGTDLRETILRDADLRDADLKGARLDATDFSGADLRKADLLGLELSGGRFVGAIYNLETRWSPTDEPTQPPPGALGPSGQAAGIVLQGAMLMGQDFYNLSAPGSDLSGAQLQGTALIDADLTGALLVGADLSRGRLERTGLVGADLTGAVLRDADLKGADAREAVLEEADLTGADLRDSDLRGARLCGANLSRANLSRVRLDGAEICARTQLPRGFEAPRGLVMREPSP
jgi:serine/threonine protein kinase/uncharacterized protein YjbI with pentapeptide repeats